MQDNNLKALVAISIEVVLMRANGPQYFSVLARLERDYNCKITDCFEHPEYLKNVLKDVYENSYGKILDDLENELGEITSEKEIRDFLNVLRD
ncbi:MAG: hypothetical protein HZA82_03370 [Thaumarchaeota archaeon]|nr:hypothetical protein [Nitrososphaerota archaeon]